MDTIPHLLYKYIDAPGGVQTLKSGKLRCCSPILFNDPFDGDFDEAFGFTHDELERCQIGKVLSHARSDACPSGNETFKNLLLRIRSHLIAGRTEEEIYSQERTFSHLGRILARSGDDVPRIYRLRRTLRSFRISAFSERNDSVPLWSHYADSHRGLCLEFTKSEKTTSIFALMRRVSYVEKLPDLVSASQWAGFLLGLEDIDFEKLIFDYLTHKGYEWRHEKEWRMVIPQITSDDLIFEYLFPPVELTAVYMGLRCSDVDLYRLEALKEKRYTDMNIFKALKDRSSFSVKFSPIDK